MELIFFDSWGQTSNTTQRVNNLYQFIHFLKKIINLKTLDNNEAKKLQLKK